MSEDGKEHGKEGAAVVPLDSRRRKAAPCPVCDRPSVAEHRPFCSNRCAQIDLGRWLKGGYRIPTEERPPEGTVPEADDDDGQGERG